MFSPVKGIGVSPASKVCCEDLTTEDIQNAKHIARHILSILVTTTVLVSNVFVLCSQRIHSKCKFYLVRPFHSKPHWFPTALIKTQFLRMSYLGPNAWPPPGCPVLLLTMLTPSLHKPAAISYFPQSAKKFFSSLDLASPVSLTPISLFSFTKKNK